MVQISRAAGTYSSCADLPRHHETIIYKAKVPRRSAERP